MKTPYLIVHDCGMGGVWAIMSARSEAEIDAKYPEVKIIKERPSWMKEEEYSRISRDQSHDIDDKPRGLKPLSWWLLDAP